jgi:pyridoxine/pyridoxamine 5'-phosphate oxidase
VDADPLKQLAAWLDAARSAGEPMPEAMTIATATADGIPAARMVILRGLQRGLAFFTDLTSDKGAELAANPRAAAVLHWLRPVHRQVRVAGPVEPVSEEEANEYWRTRPAATRRNAAASYQSSVIANQAALQMRVKDMQLSPVPSAGAASVCFPTVSSSGRNLRTAFTTGSATGGQAITGRSNGCPLKDPSLPQPPSELNCWC